MPDSLVDEAIRVTVAPTQASYFAGEPFSVNITFTNTRSPESPPSQTPSRSAVHGHKRSAHSISYVPISRPPTSPGMARSTYTPIPTRGGANKPRLSRKGLIGRAPSSRDKEVMMPEARRKGLSSSKSLSISISPHELQVDVREEAISELSTPSPHNGSASPHIARSSALPLGPNHPHARKSSVMDGQLQLQDLRPPPTLSPFTSTPSASSSSFSLSLDPISELSPVSMPPTTPSIPSPIPEESSTASSPLTNITTANPNKNHAYPPAPTESPTRRPVQIGHGPPPKTTQPPRTAPAHSSKFVVPNTELILYSYAQLRGTLSITDTGATQEQLDTLNMLRSKLLKRQVLGGGSMDITASLNPTDVQPPQSFAGRRMVHSRSASLFSVLAPQPTSSQPWSPTHRHRIPSMFALFPSSSTSSDEAEPRSAIDEEVDPELPLPMLEMQPSMIAVDLSLAPGESRSYTYTIALPDNLPPTFKGRALKFAYQFVLGVCRATPASSAPQAAHSTISNSRVMKVPIRIYNHVAVGKVPRPYDLLWPVAKAKRSQPPAQISEESKLVPHANSALNPAQPTITRSGTYDDLRDYARNLLNSLPEPNVNSVRIKLPKIISSPDGDTERDREHEEGALSGCRQAVEILTRNPKKASYDVNKDGVKVAVLTFTKSAYRLGETVLGVVELNERDSRARVLKLSAMLEAHESLPSSVSSAVNSRHMRRVHAEQHSSFMTSTLRTTFSLDIPPDASPAFQVDIGSDSPIRGSPSRAGGLEWKVRLCLLVAVASPHAREGPDGVRLRNLVRDGTRGEWGASWKAAPSIAPMERLDLRAHSKPGGPQDQSGTGALGWVSYFAASWLGPSNAGYHDGDEDLDDDDVYQDGGLDYGGSEDEWRDVKVEMVECEVPIKVWPGNTAFKATQIVFDV